MKLTTAAQLFKGLADRTRLRILNVLIQAGPMSGTGLADLLLVPRARVARHLRYLHKSRLVAVARRGREASYGVSAEGDAIHKGILRTVQGVLPGLDGMSKDARRIRGVRRRK